MSLGNFVNVDDGLGEAHAEVIEVQYSVGFVVYFMALGNFVNVDDDFGFERLLRLSRCALIF